MSLKWEQLDWVDGLLLVDVNGLMSRHPSAQGSPGFLLLLVQTSTASIHVGTGFHLTSNLLTGVMPKTGLPSNIFHLHARTEIV